jgi:hypothetical protein
MNVTRPPGIKTKRSGHPAEAGLTNLTASPPSRFMPTTNRFSTSFSMSP